MNILETPQDLIHEELDMLIRQLLRFYDVVEIRTHQRSHQVYILERVIQGWGRCEDVQ